PGHEWQGNQAVPGPATRPCSGPMNKYRGTLNMSSEPMTSIKPSRNGNWRLSCGTQVNTSAFGSASFYSVNELSEEISDDRAVILFSEMKGLRPPLVVSADPNFVARSHHRRGS